MQRTRVTSPGALVALAVAVACAVVVGFIMVGALTRGDSDAVGDLPTVDEVVAAQAHRHGIDLPELSDEEAAALLVEPTAGTDASAYEQLRAQLTAVADADGVDVALFLLGEVVAVSPEAAAECTRLFADITGSATGSGRICPAA